MKLTFKDQETDKKFKEYVCENKNVLDVLLWFGEQAKNPIVRILFRTIGQILDVVCPEKKT